jgi:hypothetical protein
MKNLCVKQVFFFIKGDQLNEDLNDKVVYLMKICRDFFCQGNIYQAKTVQRVVIN